MTRRPAGSPSRDSFAAQTGDALSLHRYVFGNNDPVNNVDPSGNDPESDEQIWENVQKAVNTILQVTLAVSAWPYLRRIGLVSIPGFVEFAAPIALFSIGWAIPILGTVSAIADILNTNRDLYELKQLDPIVTSLSVGRGQTVSHLIKLANLTLDANFAFAILNLATLVIAVGITAVNPLAAFVSLGTADLIGIGLYILQTYTNAKLNEGIAGDVVTLLNFGYGAAARSEEILDYFHGIGNTRLRQDSGIDVHPGID